MYVRVYAYVHVHVHVHVYVHVGVSVCVYIYIYIYLSVCEFEFICICMTICMYAPPHAYAYAFVCVYVYVYAHCFRSIDGRPTPILSLHPRIAPCRPRDPGASQSAPALEAKKDPSGGNPGSPPSVLPPHIPWAPKRPK